MEKLIDTAVFKFNPNTLKEVRQELDLDYEGVLDEMIDNFEDWISKQNHFTRKRFDRRYLEATIIARKGSLERAKNTLDKLCTLKTLLPHFFSKLDVKNDIMDMSGFLIQSTMPILRKNNYRVHITKMLSSDYDSSMLLDAERIVILMSEYAKCHDYCLGYTWVADFRDVNVLSFLAKVNILDLRNCLSILVEGYGFRLNGIHLLSASKSIDAAVSILKQVLSTKLGNRIHVHKTLESLYEHIPREILPVEYGGEQEPLKKMYENWIEVLNEEKNLAYLREMCKSCTDEKHRITEKYNDQILGMPGSFRTLKID